MLAADLGGFHGGQVRIGDPVEGRMMVVVQVIWPLAVHLDLVEVVPAEGVCAEEGGEGTPAMAAGRKQSWRIRQ